MAHRIDIFGKTPEGDVVERHTLEGTGGFEVRVLTFGGRLCSVRAPDRGGRSDEVLLGFDDLQAYLDDSFYFGAIIGRYANRIPWGRFALDGQEYHLSLNKPYWTLHGGKRGFDHVLWSADPNASERELRLTHESPHLAQGFPGTLRMAVTYRIEAPATLRIDYEAVTDRPTIVNFTQHPYFNLAGAGSGTVRDHVAWIGADAFLQLDDHLPTGQILPVAGTALDFRQPKAIGQDLGTGLATIDGGYDHTYVVPAPPAPGALQTVARVYEPGSGRMLEVAANQPGMQFYTGNQLDGSVHGHGGAYHKFASFTLEPEHFPDAVHHPTFPSTRLDPGQTYRSTSIFTFSAPDQDPFSLQSRNRPSHVS